eukprot:181150_1
MTTTKRTLTDTTISTFPPTKKRKLITDTNNNTIENESKEIAKSDPKDTQTNDNESKETTNTSQSKSDTNETTNETTNTTDLSKWKLKESAFTFGDNSNILSNNNTLNEIKNNQNKDSDPWGGIWGDSSNTDGTFKLKFDWGNWENDNNKIDLNPSTAIGWQSQAIKYDPNDINENKETKKK